MAHHVSLSVRMTVPYVPTFLGYREVGPFEQLVSMLKSECPDRLPDVFMIDGNGTLHPRGFGCACQFGLQLGVSAMGVAKNLLETEEHHPDSARLKSNEGSFLDQSQINWIGVHLPNCTGILHNTGSHQHHGCWPDTISLCSVDTLKLTAHAVLKLVTN
ncbi:unnamed protein product [Dicrocoelium dendriticum]|nr:unnamed protein product [Dicrocoelium dendriticum]